MKFGVHCWVYCQLAHREAGGGDLAGTLARVRDKLVPTIVAEVAAAGFDQFETMSALLDSPAGRDAHAAALAAGGVGLCGFSHNAAYWDPAQRQAILGLLEPLCQWSGAHGGRHLGISATPVPGRPKTPADWDAQAETIAALSAMARPYGVVPNLHTYDRDALDDFREVRELAARLDQATFELGPDLAWLAKGGGNVLDFVARFGDRITFCHVRDRTAENQWAEAIGDGVDDFAALGRALRAHGFDGPVVFEPAFESWAPTRPVSETLALSAARLHAALGA